MSNESNKINYNSNSVYKSRVSSEEHKKNIFEIKNSKFELLNNNIQHIKINSEDIGHHLLFSSNEIEKSGCSLFEENLMEEDLFNNSFSLPKSINCFNFFSENNLFRINSEGNEFPPNETIKDLNKSEIDEEKMLNTKTIEDKINKEELNKKSNRFISTYNKRGRKTKNKSLGKHNKFTADNIRRKIKHLVLKNVVNWINKIIEKIYEGNIGNSIYKKKFLMSIGRQKSNADIEYNKEFLNKTVGDILSDPISKRYTSLSPDFNKKLVENLLNEKDIIKKNYFNNFFNLTFLKCLNHYIGKEKILELDGMDTFEKDKISLEQDEEYKYIIKYHIENFSRIMEQRKSRKKK